MRYLTSTLYSARKEEDTKYLGGVDSGLALWDIETYFYLYLRSWEFMSMQFLQRPKKCCIINYNSIL